MRLVVSHRTVYHYDSPSSGLAQLLRMTPSDGPGQAVLSWSVADERGRRPRCFVDGFGNLTHLHTRRRPHARVEVRVEGVVETRDTFGVQGFAGDRLPPGYFARTTPLTAPHPAIETLAQEAREGSDALDRLHRLMALVSERVAYRPGATGVGTTAAEALLAGAGVCQDHAHLYVAAARALGHPARYVSGYVQADAGEAGGLASHAWAEAWHPELGWIGFDASHGICPSDRYVRVAVALDYEGAAPLRGVRRGAPGERLEVEVSVRVQPVEQ
jgi:transglutaminase-like putative cysteine protease